MVRIRISNADMLNLITKHSIVEPEAPDLLEHIYVHGFIFNEFTLIWENMYTYKVRIKGVLDKQNIHVKKIVRTKEGSCGHKVIDFTLESFLNNQAKYLKIMKNKTFKDVTRQMVDDTWSADYIPVISFMLYALYNALHQEVINKEKTDRVYKKSSRTRKSNPKVEYTLSEVITHYATHMNHTKHHITCPKWEVKGHPRHYKNGKVSWVRPYTKGANKGDIVKDRTYVLDNI